MICTPNGFNDRKVLIIGTRNYVRSFSLWFPRTDVLVLSCGMDGVIDERMWNMSKMLVIFFVLSY